ncbi:MAG: hypothetical protein ACI4DZ_04865 [Oliverpabstia sp.]
MAYFVNKNVLDNINLYKNRMDGIINSFFQQIQYQCNYNVFITSNYKLYSLIAENIRMDLNYLLTITIDYDVFSFIGVRRNLRNSIEAYYDLYNLTFDENYLYLLKYFSNNAVCAKKEIDTLKNNDMYSSYLGKKQKISFLSIADKAKIASRNGLDNNKVNILKNISISSNSYVHPDIFTPPEDIQAKERLLRDFLYIDCWLLAEAFDLLVRYCRKKFSVGCLFNSYEELEMLQRGLYQCGYYIEKR